MVGIRTCRSAAALSRAVQAPWFEELFQLQRSYYLMYVVLSTTASLL
jgi:hypothetical protein